MLEEHGERVGWFDDAGDPRRFTQLYMSALREERRALSELSVHVRADRGDAASELRRYLADNHRG